MKALILSEEDLNGVFLCMGLAYAAIEKGDPFKSAVSNLIGRLKVAPIQTITNGEAENDGTDTSG